MAHLDRVVIHVDDYVGLLDAEVLPSPEAAANPLDAVILRLGPIQINVHGPWPGLEGTCCPPPWNEVGRGDLAFRTDETIEQTRARLADLNADVTYGPVDAFGAQGWGRSIYTLDPGGNGIEIIHHEHAAQQDAHDVHLGSGTK